MSHAFALDVPPKVYDIAKSDLTQIATDPVIIEAVEKQNARHSSLADIQALDKKWIATPGLADYMKALIDSPAGKRLTEWAKAHPYASEIILMDNQGANVALTEKTSDYWQGDEAKFTECFKNGGLVYVDKVKFDDSSQTYSVQVSVPVKDGDKLIGALCVGVDIETLP